MTELGHFDKAPPEGSEDWLRQAIHAAVGSVFTSGNSIVRLKNGVEIFPAMLEAIEEARESIDFVTFIYWTGDIAQRFARLLAKRARDGISIRVILDGFGSLPMRQELIDIMTESGVQLERFRPIVRWKVWESDHRTHRKILVVDNQVAFTGGVGIAEEWEGDARNPNEWRETHFRVEGPAVLGLRAAFLTDWRDCGHVIDEADIDVALPAEAGTIEMAAIDGSAQIGYNDAERALEAVIAAARQRILIQTPYFNPSEGLGELLTAVAERGVAVDVVIPGPHIDKRIAEIAAEKTYQPMLGSGVRVWIYQPTMMHVKAVVVDGTLSMIGSANFNRRSAEKDEEAVLAVIDRDLAKTLEVDFREDVRHSVAASTERTLRHRVAAALIKPIQDEM
ncbi:MAG: cardiolipin synthase B [Actinobacteria bacterium]|nr:MAG: cardiolipin synthase B [Actinomycetota bacterium]